MKLTDGNLPAVERKISSTEGKLVSVNLTSTDGKLRSVNLTSTEGRG